MSEVDLRIRSVLDKSGFSAAAKEMAAIERQQIASTRRQIAESRKVSQLTAKLDKDLANEQKKAAQASREWGQAAAVAFGILAKAGVDAVAAARESAASDRELLGVLNSTGKGAGEYKNQLSALATELENNSNFTDEAVQHAEGLLLTFDKVGRDVLPRATQATADLAELMNGDLQGAAVGVGKALDGQISSLKKSGVSFTAAQEEQITALFKTGKAAQAQGIILTQLEKQVAGQAKAAREAAGGMKDMEVSAGRLQEAMGGLLLTIGDGGFTDFASGFLDKLSTGAKAWEGAIENMRILAEARERAVKEAGDQATVRRGAFGQAVGSAVGDEALAKAVSEVAEEHRKAKEAADQHAKSLKENTAATEENATSQEDLSQKLEAANQARKNVAGSLLDIEDKAAKDTAAAWDDYFKEEQTAWKDYSKNIDKINADSAEDQVKIQKDLTKSLAKEDKSLASDLAKIKTDSARAMGYKLQDQARQEKQDRRQRQIDAKGDERLFQFDMRQLAAEGEFNAILAAKERRAIEQQIASEKDADQQKTTDENNQVELDRMRQAEADQLAERQAQAEERRQELIDQAAEAEQQRQEELGKALADEQQSYQDRLAALREARDQKLAQIEETKNESIAKLAEELTTNKDMTRAEMEATIKIAEELGPQVGAAYAEGLNDGFARNLRINQIASAAMGSGSNNNGSVNPAHPTVPTNIGQQQQSRNPARQNMNSIYGFASGGQFTVGGNGGTDSQLVQFLATPGERVTVSQPGGGVTINQTINGGGQELARRIAAVTQAAAEREIERYHNEVIAPWSNGV